MREGKLKGQRVGNQWFVDEAAIGGELEKPEPLITRGMLAEIDEIARRESRTKSGLRFYPVEMVRRAREER